MSGRALGWFAGLVISIAGVAWCQEASGADAVLRHANQLQQTGDIVAAISEYRIYLDQVPDNVMARSNLGAALARSGHFEEAVVEYQKALEVEPGNLPVRLNLALAYYKASQVSEAAAELERVLEQRRDRQPVLLLADCYLRLGENKKVIDLLSPLQQAAPDDKALDYLLGSALIRDGQAAPGQLLVDRIVRDGESAEGRLLIGESKLSANDFVGALESPVRENPRDVEAHISLATVYCRLKRKEDGNQQRAIVLQLNAEKQAAVSGGMPK